MAADTPKPLQFPLPFADVPPYIFIVNVPREEVPGYLGPPMLVDYVEGLGQTDFWAFQYPCGLQVAFQFSQQPDCGLVLADSPEFQHILRHIPIPDHKCVRIDNETLASELELLVATYPGRREEIDTLYSYQVWRQGTDGNPFKVGGPTSKRDAVCWVNHFESLGHHQHYWYATVGNNTD